MRVVDMVWVSEGKEEGSGGGEGEGVTSGTPAASSQERWEGLWRSM